MLLCGELNKNLKQIEKALKIKVLQNGTEFNLSGKEEDVQIGVSALYDLKQKLETNSAITSDVVHLSLHTAKFSNQEAEGSDSLQIKTPRVLVTARGKNQNNYLEHIKNSDLTFGVGPSGTGKTFLAVASAVDDLIKEKIRKIVLVRPAVEAGERLGFLPGDLSSKIDPYLRPLYDALHDMLGAERVNRLVERDIIEIAPLAYMRGRTLREAFIIMDEGQNTTIEQMKMFLTRLGFGSKAVVNGDLSQIDLPKSSTSGLKHAIDVLKNVDSIKFTKFGAKDVVRHSLVQEIVEAYDNFE
ncbi:MAG: phosphate starvation-inducible protein PhoH [Gammaproteobacteria bacterium]|jgi:phosphate starvation-inducible PhoH-like protein|nr:phosphate starvation-inducible protein PhoH [Gammaproteobacteria bacterium]|tara:strand:- start:406 stop:1302 length:897 start_codon:yes stop_codon:yes gene_type:complete